MGFMLVVGLVLLILGLSNGADDKGSTAMALIGIIMLFIGIVMLLATGSL